MVHPDFAHLPPVSGGTLDSIMRGMAIHYHGLPKEADPGSAASYAAFIAETDRQFARIPIRIEWSEEDPYHSSAELFADIDARGAMRVFQTPAAGQFHPVMGAEENNRFRAVHDYFAHYIGRSGKDRNQFGPKGELAAFRAHLQMFPPIALPALAAETAAQQAWVNWGPDSLLPARERRFADQKGTAIHPAYWLPLLDDPLQLVRIGSSPALWSHPSWRPQDGVNGVAGEWWGYFNRDAPSGDWFGLAGSFPGGGAVAKVDQRYPEWLARRV